MLPLVKLMIMHVRSRSQTFTVFNASIHTQTPSSRLVRYRDSLTVNLLHHTSPRLGSCARFQSAGGFCTQLYFI